MHIEQILFVILVITATAIFIKNGGRLVKSIRLGKKMEPITDQDKRWRRVFLNALGQKKMFKRPLPAILHLFVYAGFVIINIEVLEIMLDGIFNQHRLFSPILGFAYPVFISIFEFLAIAVLISCVIFLIRRNVIKVKRLNMYELRRWPRMDANIILITEIVLMSAFLILNTADLVLQTKHNPHYTETGIFFFSGMLMPLFEGLSDGQLVILERAGWWFHITGIFAFLNYLPFSKHLHILFAFPNAYFADVKPQGKMENMPDIAKEVQLMLNPEAAASAEPPAEPGRFGAKDIFDLNQRDLLGAFSCTECGRCTAMCPANITGKLLSPRKIMMDTRDRCEEVIRKVENDKIQDYKTYDDGKALIGDYITHEELLACTTCQACVEACPVNINPLSIISQLRRYMIMEEAKSPNAWNVMFSNIENNQAPWQFSPYDRFKWGEEMNSEQ